MNFIYTYNDIYFTYFVLFKMHQINIYLTCSFITLLYICTVRIITTFI